MINTLFGVVFVTDVPSCFQSCPFVLVKCDATLGGS